MTEKAEKPVKKPVVKKAKETSEKPVVVKKTPTKSESIYAKGVQHMAYGKRKNATARVILRPGSGKFLINDAHDLNSYFGNRQVVLSQIVKPFRVVDMENQYDVFANLHGGGKFGQAGALAHAIAKTIVVINPTLKKRLKDESLITRDSRVKEAKKYGRKKARKGYTYRKR